MMSLWVSMVLVLCSPTLVTVKEGPASTTPPTLVTQKGEWTGLMGTLLALTMTGRVVDSTIQVCLVCIQLCHPFHMNNL